MHQNNTKYRPDIDGLRAIAVLCVIGFHAFPEYIHGGFVGVDVFFIISGFLITRIILTGLDENKFSFIDFYKRRIKRLFPSLLTILLACYILGWFILFSDEYKQLGKHIAGGATYLSNIILWQESGYFDNSSETKPLLHLWSLGIEEQYYLIWPLFIWFLWKIRLRSPLVILAIAAPLFVLNIFQIKVDKISTFYLPHTRFWELLLGAALASATISSKTNKTQFYTDDPEAYHRAHGESHRHAKLLIDIASCTGICIVLAASFWISKDTPYPGWWALLPTVGTVILIAAGPNAWVNQTILSNKILVWLGLISFPLYLWHWPLLSFARIIESTSPSVGLRASLAALSIALAAFTFYCIEKPIRFGISSRRLPLYLLSALLLMGIVGLHAYSKDGIGSRMLVTTHADMENELHRPAFIDEACKKYIHNDNPQFTYCRYNDVKGKETIAVIGDSHAHAAYTGLAESMGESGNNTVLLAMNACPTFIGGEYGSDSEQIESRKKQIDAIIKYISEKSDISKVILVSRGTLYMTGKGFGEAEKEMNSPPLIQADQFKQALQTTVDFLSSYGKKTYYVMENPEIGIDPRICISRPLKSSSDLCSINKATVETRQQVYNTLVNSVQNTEIINVIDTFCPDSDCFIVKDNKLLYADDDHLSVSGSRFQAYNILQHLYPRQQMSIAIKPDTP